MKVFGKPRKPRSLASKIRVVQKIRAEIKCPVCGESHYSASGFLDCIEKNGTDDTREELKSRLGEVAEQLATIIAMGTLSPDELTPEDRESFAALPGFDKIAVPVRFVCTYCLPDLEYTTDPAIATVQVEAAYSDLVDHYILERNVRRSISHIRNAYYAAGALWAYLSVVLYNNSGNKGLLLASTTLWIGLHIIPLSHGNSPRASVLRKYDRQVAVAMITVINAAHYFFG